MDVIVWLKEMFRRELDLRPPSLAKINEKSVIIYDNDNIPIAHAIRTNRWEGFEINSLVVDPNHRGKGISHKLLEKCGTGSTTPGFLSSLNVLISRLAMISWMILSLEFKRIMHQLKHIRDYKLYVRE